MKLPQPCVVDTNVPKTANCAVDSANCDARPPLDCIAACVTAIEKIVTRRCKLVMDAGDEIFTEYLRQLSPAGQPGLGDHFMKWVNQHRYDPQVVDRVPIHAVGRSYAEFPRHPGLKQFDLSDRKFVAVANAHPDKPPILQATDSKWWGWAGALRAEGLRVRFLCPQYIKAKYRQKIGGKT